MTKELIDAIANLARNTPTYFKHMYKDPYAFDVFEIAIDTLLTKVRPKGEPIPPPDDGEFRPGGTPETAGRAPATGEIISRGLS
jgi:hypothetical protein